MRLCSIIHCGAKKNKNQPQLTLHKFPRQEYLRQKWIDAIGIENINPRHKMWYVCSLHFEECSFNRSLDAIRLHDNAVPLSSFRLCKRRSRDSVLNEMNTQELSTDTVVYENAPILSIQSSAVTENVSLQRTEYEAQLFKSSSNSSVSEMKTQELSMDSEAPILLKQSSVVTANTSLQRTEYKVQGSSLTRDKSKKKTCQEFRKKIKILNETVRRRNKTIANLKNIVKDLRNQLNISTK